MNVVISSEDAPNPGRFCYRANHGGAILGIELTVSYEGIPDRVDRGFLDLSADARGYELCHEELASASGYIVSVAPDSFWIGLEPVRGSIVYHEGKQWLYVDHSVGKHRMIDLETGRLTEVGTWQRMTFFKQWLLLDAEQSGRLVRSFAC